MEPHICRCSGLYVCGWRHIWQNDYLYAINAKVYHGFMQEDLRVTILENEEYRNEIFKCPTSVYRFWSTIIHFCFYDYILSIKTISIPFLKLQVRCQACDLAPSYLRSTLRRRKYSLPIWLCKSVQASFPCNIWKLELCKFLCNEGCTKLEHRT